MNAVPLRVALPLLVAFFLMASAQHLGQTARQCLALLVALAVGIGGLLLSHHCATHGAQVYWFGGWTPRPGWMPGICFQLDSLNCLFVALSGFLTANAVLFSWGYFKQVKAVYESLLLIFAEEQQMRPERIAELRRKLPGAAIDV